MSDKPDLSKLIPKLNIPKLDIPSIPPVRPLDLDLNLVRSPLVVDAEENRAEAFHRRLRAWISDFDRSLDDAHEVGIRLVSFGQTIVFHLETMGYWNPSLISFSGHTEDGNPVELIQHVSQISILLTRVPRQDTSTPKMPIGFRSPSSESLAGGNEGSAV